MKIKENVTLVTFFENKCLGEPDVAMTRQRL